MNLKTKHVHKCKYRRKHSQAQSVRAINSKSLFGKDNLGQWFVYLCVASEGYRSRIAQNLFLCSTLTHLHQQTFIHTSFPHCVMYLSTSVTLATGRRKE